MSRFNTHSITVGIISVALAGLALGESACAMQPVSPVAAKTTAEGRCGEGKCGEGRCGDASFAKHDTDHDGLVSRAEFLAAAPQAAAEFPKLDIDGDGFISEKEAYDALRATYEANGKPMPVGRFAKYK